MGCRCRCLRAVRGLQRPLWGAARSNGPTAGHSWVLQPWWQHLGEEGESPAWMWGEKCQKQPWKHQGEKRRILCSPWRNYGGAGIALQPVEDHAGADIQTASNRGSHAGASGYGLMEPEVRGGSVLEQTPDSNCSPWGGGEKCAEEGASEELSWTDYTTPAGFNWIWN